MMALVQHVCSVFFFFFQAEDGIRDKLVTGVQTCALPISASASFSSAACVIRDADQTQWTQRTQRETNWSCRGVLRVLCVDSAPLYRIESRSKTRKHENAINAETAEHAELLVSSALVFLLSTDHPRQADCWRTRA